MHRSITDLLLVGALFVSLPLVSQVQAAVVEAECTVQAVDAERNSITVLRTDGGDGKPQQLRVAPNAKITSATGSSLEDVKVGDKASVAFNTQTKKVVAVKVVPSEDRPSNAPAGNATGGKVDTSGDTIVIDLPTGEKIKINRPAVGPPGGRPNAPQKPSVTLPQTSKPKRVDQEPQPTPDAIVVDSDRGDADLEKQNDNVVASPLISPKPSGIAVAPKEPQRNTSTDDHTPPNSATASESSSASSEPNDLAVAPYKPQRGQSADDHSSLTKTKERDLSATSAPDADAEDPASLSESAPHETSTVPKRLPWHESELPTLSNILGEKTRPRHPLAILDLQVPRDSTGFILSEQSTSIANRIENEQVFKSARGSYVIGVMGTRVTDSSTALRTARIWTYDSGRDITPVPKNGEGLYLPLVFNAAEDECFSLDGQYLRAWGVSDNSAMSLLASHKTPLVSKGDSDTLACTPGFIWWRSNSVQYAGGHKVIATAYGDKRFSTDIAYSEPKVVGSSGYTGVLATNGTLAASIDGIEGRSGDLFINDIATGKVLSKVSIASYRLSSTLPPIEPYAQDDTSGCAVVFTPTGDRLLVSVLSPDATSSVVGIFDLTKKKPVGALQLPVGHRIACVDPAWQLAAVLKEESAETATSTEYHYTCLVYGLLDGRKLGEFPLGDGWTRRYTQDGTKLETTPCLAFSADREELVGLALLQRDDFAQPQQAEAETRQDEHARVRQRVYLSAGKWRVADGQPLAQAVTELDASWLAKSFFERQPKVQLLDCKVGLMRANGQRIFIDADRVLRMSELLQQSDRDWTAGQYEKAWHGYSDVLVDHMRWFFVDRLSQLAARGVDAYATVNASDKAKLLADWCNECGIPTPLETKAGKLLEGKWRQEEAERIAAAEVERKRKEKEEAERVAAAEEERRRQEEVAMVEQEQRRKERVKELADIRKRNQAQRIQSRLLSKSDFKEKLRSTMDRGRIDDLASQAHFENFAFQDVFGEPDSNAAFENTKRLYSYRCADGSIQLTVIVQDSRVILFEVNEY